MQTVTLAAEDFKTIHNTLCELRGLAQRMEQSMVKIGEVERIIESFEAGLKDAYDQDNAQFESKMDYFSEFKAANGLQAIWSLYELSLQGFEEAHPYPSDAFIVYTQHWGDGAKDRHYPVLGSTWGDVYRAADLAIRESGDTHHCFIEGFEVKGLELHMYTGS
jgi:hypothetical protein